MHGCLSWIDLILFCMPSYDFVCGMTCIKLVGEIGWNEFYYPLTSCVVDFFIIYYL